MSLTCRSPVIVTVTMPPPAEASIVSLASASWAFIMSACIFWTCLSIWFMFGCGHQLASLSGWISSASNSATKRSTHSLSVGAAAPAPRRRRPRSPST